MSGRVVGLYLAFIVTCLAQPPASAPQSEQDAKASADKAKTSADSAKTSADSAKTSADNAKTGEKTAATSAGNADSNAKAADVNAQAAGANAQAAGANAQAAGANAQAAGANAQAAGINAQAAGTNAQAASTNAKAASTSAASATDSARRGKSLLRLIKSDTENTSYAVPVSVQIKPTYGGNSLSLSVTCATLSSRECEIRSKPVTVLVRQVHSGPLPPTPLGTFTPKYAGGIWTVDLNPKSVSPGISVSVIYDEGRQTTEWEPVLPDADTPCCTFVTDPTGQPIFVQADVPIDKDVVFLRATDQKTQQPFQVRGTPSFDHSSWNFAVPAGSLGKGSSVKIMARIDGQLVQIAQSPPYGGAPITSSQSKSMPDPPPPQVVAASPAPMPGAIPALTTPGDSCRPPDTSITNASLVTVNIYCKPKPGGLVLYIDNQRQVEGRDFSWNPVPGNPYQLMAALTMPLLPFQALKVLEFDPAQTTADSVASVWEPAALPAAPAGRVAWWVAPPTQPGAVTCAPPTIVEPLRPGMALTVRFPDPRAPTTCHPDLSQTRVYADNVLIGAKWLYSASAPLTYTAELQVPVQAYQRVKVLQFSPPQNVPDPAVTVQPGPAATPMPVPAPPAITTGTCADPYIQNAPGLTDSISAILGCMPDDLNQLKLLVNGKQVEATWTLSPVSPPITANAKMTSKLKDGDSVQVVQPNQRDSYSPAQVAAGPPKPPPIGSIQTVQEGATTVSGLAPGLDKVRVEVKDGKSLGQHADATVDSTTNAFTATLSNPLQANQELQVYGVSKSGTRSDSPTNVEVQQLGLDWGRVRGYFTAGVILSNNNSQLNLTSANTFLDFNIDKQWFHPSPSFSRTSTQFFDRFSFNTFFDARLTAIPTGTTGSSASGSTPTLSAGASGGTPTASTTSSTTSSTSTSSSTGNPSANPTSLLSNSQAAELQVGAYVPFTIGSWDLREVHYSLFAAPIAKVGFYTLTQAGSAANQAAENDNRSNSTFFPFYSWGLRLGHRRDFDTDDGRTNRNRAPEQLSYLDITLGKWSNFEYLEPYNFTTSLTPTCTMPASNPSTAACDVRDRMWRYGFEGLLVIPNTPLVLGLSANVSAQHPRGPGAFFLAPPDDLRFLFGVRFDASKFTGLLTKIAGAQ